MFYRHFDESKSAWTFRANLKRIALFCVLAAAAFWLACAAAVYCGFKYLRKYEEISFFDVLQMPFSTDKYRVEMGESLIRKAKECIKNEDIQGAFANILNGVARSPDNLEARMILANMYFIFAKDSAKAAQTLDLKIAKAFELNKTDYLALSISVFCACDAYREKSAHLISACVDSGVISEKSGVKILSNIFKHLNAVNEYGLIEDYAALIISSSKSVPLRKTAAVNAAVSMVSNSESGKALALLKSAGINSGETFALVLSANMAENGDEITALKLLNKAIKKFPKRLSFYEILARISDDFGDEEGAKNARKVARLMSKDITSAPLEEIRESEGNEAVKLAKKFASDFPDKISRLSKIAALSKNPELIDYCLSQKQNPKAEIILKLSKVETYICQNNPRDALSTLDSVKFGPNKALLEDGRKLSHYEMAINALSGKDVFKDIAVFVAYSDKRPQNVLSLAKLLQNAGLDGHAIYAAECGLAAFPNNARLASIFCESAMRKNDPGAIIGAMDKYGIRVPVKYMAKLGDFARSDRMVFMGPEKTSELAKKSAEAAEKIEKFKKLQGNF